MAIGNIVCRSGVGPTATIALFITHGFGVGSSISTVDTHDGFRKKKPHVSDEEIKRVGEELRRKEAEKLAYAQELRKQLMEVMNPSPELVEEAKEVLTPVEFIEITNDRREQIQELLAKAENELQFVQLQQKAHEIALRQAKDEEDIRIIMMALSAPFQTIH